jgi:hypothetical protein
VLLRCAVLCCVQNYGLAVGHLKDSNGMLVKTSKLVITGWSDNKTPANVSQSSQISLLSGSTCLALWVLQLALV